MILSRTNRVQIGQDNFCPLGLTLWRDDQIERGADELRKAFELNPEDRDASKALEMIRAMSKTSGRRHLRRDTPEVSRTAKSLA